MNKVELESKWLKAVVLPEIGCKIQNLYCKTTGKEILWQNPRIRPQTFPVDSNFDNYWSGGWDDAFPTCDACEYSGERYPNLGELRSVEWSTAARSERHACFTAHGPISPVLATKTVTLDLDRPVLRMHFRLDHVGVLPIDYIWGTHPALQVNADSIIRIPGRTGIVGVSSGPEFGHPGQSYQWPTLAERDLSRVQPASSGRYAGHFVTGLEAGWFAVEDEAEGCGTVFSFPRELCPNLWLWMCYGGWRGYSDVVVIEPWTSRPIALDAAVAAGSHRTLERGGQFDIEIRMTRYTVADGLDAALGRIRF